MLAQETETGGNKASAKQSGIPWGMLPGQIARVHAIAPAATNIVTSVATERKRFWPHLVFGLRLRPID